MLIFYHMSSIQLLKTVVNKQALNRNRISGVQVFFIADDAHM